MIAAAERLPCLTRPRAARAAPPLDGLHKDEFMDIRGHWRTKKLVRRALYGGAAEHISGAAWATLDVASLARVTQFAEARRGPVRRIMPDVMELSRAKSRHRAIRPPVVDRTVEDAIHAREGV